MKVPTKITDIDQSMIDMVSGKKPRVRANLDGSYTVRGVDGPANFFGPMQPLPPGAQEDAWGRQFDYPSGVNTRIQPRQEERVSFDMLKNLADGYDILRIIIERVKELIIAGDWTIGPKDESKPRDKRCDAMQEFFEMPDKEHTWEEWLIMILEQLLVLDAVSLLTQRTRGGDVYALQVIDGATIRRVLNNEGRTPLPPDPAYQEILKGIPAVDYTTDDLIYKPRNLRVHKIYGYSPVEQVITSVNIALHRQMYQLNYYTEGATPDLLFSVPSGWSSKQILEFKQAWDAMLKGNLGERRGTMFVHDGMKPINTKEKALTDEADEWLVRICCFAFSISPTPFIKQMNRATAESHHEQAMQEGLEPTQRYISRLVNFIMRTRFGIADLTHKWVEDEAIDPLEQSEIYKNYVGIKVYHPDEVRQKLGDAPMTPEMREQLAEPDYSSSPNAITPDPAGGGEEGLVDANGKPAPKKESSKKPIGKTPVDKKPEGGSDSAKLGKSEAVGKYDRLTKNVVLY